MRSDEESTSQSTIENDTSKIATTSKTDSIYTSSGNQNDSKGSILSEPHFTKKTNDSTSSESVNSNPDAIENKVPSNSAVKSNIKTETNKASKKVSTPSNFTIQKILNGCKTGETLTQEELSKNLEIPKDAIKLVKSITKISEDEIDVKWNSTWAVEKLSDAKFKDGRLKVRFENNKMYTSGNAIGIKYKRKIYTDLVVYGRAARIPSVKGYYWKIGRD